jgi:LAS superfamily LD-carboxypeptidase LdcB
MGEKLDIATKICEDYVKKKFSEYEADVVAHREAYALAITFTASYSGTYSSNPGKIWPNDITGLGLKSGNPTTYGDLFKWLFDKDYGSPWYSKKEIYPNETSERYDEVTGEIEKDPRISIVDLIPTSTKEDVLKPEDAGVDIIEAKISDPAISKAYSTLSTKYNKFRLYHSYKEIMEKITPAKFTEAVVTAFVSNLTSAKIKNLSEKSLYNFWYGMQGSYFSGKRSMADSDIGAMDVVSRNYPLIQNVFGGNAYVFIDYPWKGDENSKKLLEAIKEKSDDPSVNTPPPTTSGTSGTSGTAGTAGTSGTGPQKYKPFVEGLEDGFQIDAKTDLPEFKIYVSDPETWKQLGTEEAGEGEDSFSNVDGAEEDDEYSEAAFQGSEEEQIKLDLTTFLSQGDSEGSDDDNSGGGGGDTGPSGGDVQTGGGVNTNKSQSAGGSGDRRFQKQMTLNGRVVKNGELPDDLLAKLDFCSFKVEKNAARRLNELNVAYKAQFGKNIALSGGFRTFKTQNDIFDWDYYEKYKKGRKKGTNGGVAAATPGGSKHGWGQAIDCSGFGSGPGNKYFDWMEANAKKYGWVNPAWAKKSGAGYEPWHWEYIGSDLFK